MLMNCPECEHELSSKAASCPRCGHPLNPKRGCLSKFLWLVGGAVALVAVVLLLSLWLMTQGSSSAEAIYLLF